MGITDSSNDTNDVSSTYTTNDNTTKTSTDVVKIPHTALFRSTWRRKPKKVLDLFENEYRHHFDYILILCPTLRCNKTNLIRP